MRKDRLLACALAVSCAMGLSAEAGAVSICIDPGHGGSDPGALGCGLRETEINLSVSLKLKALLENAGYTVHMTRTTEKDVGLSQRASYANSKGVNTFASIHTNSATSSAATGIETFCYIGNKAQKSGTQAQNIQTNMLAVWDLTNRGVKEANYAVVRETNMPATLSELAFIVNCNKDAVYLKSDAHRNTAAQAHCKAIVKQWGGDQAKCTGGTSGGGGGGGGSTPSTGKVMAGTFVDSVKDTNWLGGVKYSVGGQTKTSADTYQMMSFTLNVGKYTATASKDGYNSASKTDCTVTAGATAWCSLALTKKAADQPTTGTAKGAVKDSVSQAKLKNVKVSVKNGETKTYDGNTDWSFTLKPGSYQILGSLAGYTDQETTCKVEAGKTSDCTFMMTPQKGTITGKVTDGTQNVASTVSLDGKSVQYNGNDDFSFSVEAGKYTVTATADGYKPGSKSCEVKAGGSVACDITLTKNVDDGVGTLRGKVTAEGSNEAVESDVTANGETVHFSGNDYYRFSFAPGDYDVKATAEGYEDGSAQCTVVKDEVKDCNITLKPKPGAFAGILQDSVSHKPIDANAKPKITCNDTEVEVGADGTWKAELPAGTYQVTASADGYGKSVVSCVIKAGDMASPCEILLTANNVATGTLQGYVYDTRSETMRIAAKVEIDGFNSANYPGKGKWSMSGLPAGIYSVTASADGYYSTTKSCEVIAGDDENNINNCDIGLTSKDDGGAVVEAEFEEPVTYIEPYSDDCAAAPLNSSRHSNGLAAVAVGLLLGLCIRRRQTKGGVR